MQAHFSCLDSMYSCYAIFQTCITQLPLTATNASCNFRRPECCHILYVDFPPPSPTQLRHHIMPLRFLIPCSFPTLCPLCSPLLMPFPFYSPHFLPLSRMSFTSLHVSSSIRTMSFPLPFLPLFPITFHSTYLSLTYLYHLSKALQDTDSLFGTGYSNCP